MRSKFYTASVSEACLAIFGKEDVESLSVILKAQVLARALKNIGEAKNGLELARLEILWEIYAEGLVMFLGEDGKEYNPEDFPKWVTDTLSDEETIDYLRRLANVITVVFQDVHSATLTDPYLDYLGGKITVERLLNAKRVTGKLLDVSVGYQNMDRDQRQEVLSAILMGERRTDIRERLERQRQEGVERKGIVLRYSESPLPDGRTKVVMVLEPEALRLFRTLVGKTSEIVPEGEEDAS